jgi:hypothetical protein
MRVVVESIVGPCTPPTRGYECAGGHWLGHLDEFFRPHVNEPETAVCRPEQCSSGETASKLAAQIAEDRLMGAK